MTNNTTIQPQASNTLRVFAWNHSNIRTTTDSQGNTWFVAQDVCKALDLANTSRALSRLRPSMKGVTSMNTLKGIQTLTIISEPGLYLLVLRSRKAEAEAFQDWVTGHVLPAIRRDGVYVKGEERLLQSATIEELQERISELQALAAKAMATKIRRGLDGAEERLARREALRFLRGRG